MSVPPAPLPDQAWQWFRTTFWIAARARDPLSSQPCSGLPIRVAIWFPQYKWICIGTEGCVSIRQPEKSQDFLGFSTRQGQSWTKAASCIIGFRDGFKQSHGVSMLPCEDVHQSQDFLPNPFLSWSFQATSRPSIWLWIFVNSYISIGLCPCSTEASLCSWGVCPQPS